MTNLAIYFNSQAQSMLSGMSEYKITEKLEELILNDEQGVTKELDYILKLSASFQMVEKNPKDPLSYHEPTNTISLNLDSIILDVTRVQIEDAIKLAEFVNSYKQSKIERLREKEKEEMIDLRSEDLKTYLEEFKVLYEKVQRKDIKGDHQGEEKIDATLKGEEKERFKFLVDILPEYQLVDAVQEVMKILELEHQKQEIEKKKGGFFSFIFGLRNVGPQEYEDTQEIKECIDRALEHEAEVPDNEELSEKVIVFNLALKEGDVSIISTRISKVEEGLNLKLCHLSLGFEIRKGGSRIEFSIDDIVLSLMSRGKELSASQITPLLEKAGRYSKISKPFLSIRMDQNPPGEEPGLYVDLTSEPFNFTYNPIAITRLMSFKDLDTEDEELKYAAKLKVEKINEQISNAGQDFYEVAKKEKQFFNIKFSAPSIIVPFDPKDTSTCPCWVLNLGKLDINTKEAKVKADMSYLVYSMKLTNISFEYYPGVELFLKYQEAQTQAKETGVIKPQGWYDIIEDFVIEADVRNSQNPFKSQEENVPCTTAEIVVSDVYAKATPELLIYLTQLPDYIKLPKKSSMELPESQQWKLTDKIEKSGMLSYKDDLNEGGWTNYHVSIVRNYMYFFEDPNQDEPNFSIDLRSAKTHKDPQDPRRFTVKKLSFL